MLQDQVTQLVIRLTEMERQLQQTTSTILDLAGGWVPTWIEKEVFILKRVLENAPHYELFRDELIKHWQE